MNTETKNRTDKAYEKVMAITDDAWREAGASEEDIADSYLIFNELSEDVQISLKITEKELDYLMDLLLSAEPSEESGRLLATVADAQKQSVKL